MRVLVTVPSNAEVEKGALPPKEILAAMTKFNKELEKAGVLVALGGLEPTSKARKLVFAGGMPRVIDGPFTESKELIAGFWLLEVKSLDEATEWIARAPFGGGVTIELRPLGDPTSWPEELRQAAGL